MLKFIVLCWIISAITFLPPMVAMCYERDVKQYGPFWTFWGYVMMGLLIPIFLPYGICKAVSVIRKGRST